MTWKSPPCSPSLTSDGDITTPHSERGPVESCVHYLHGTIWAHHHVLQILQCSPHIPSIHEPHLHRYAKGEVAENLHGWLRNPHQGWCCPPSWAHLTGASTSSGTQAVNQTLQVHIWHPSHGVPRHDHWTGRNQDGQEEAGSHKRVETPHLSQRNLIIHQIHKLLQEVHPRLFHHCCPS